MSTQSHQLQHHKFLTMTPSVSQWNHPNYEPSTKHMVLLPKWFTEAQSNNSQLFFYYQPILESIKELMKMGVYCFVLDWRAEHSLFPGEPHTYATRFEKTKLNQSYHFHVDQLSGQDLESQANWQHILSHAYTHFNKYTQENNFRLHVHDSARYLEKYGFKVLPNQLLDAVLLPNNACTNFRDDIGVVCQPDNKAMEAVLHYLQMLVSTVGEEYKQEQEKIIQQRLKCRAEFEAYRKAHSGWEERAKRPNTIDLTCGGLFSSKKRKRGDNARGSEPLYMKELLEEREESRHKNKR